MPTLHIKVGYAENMRCIPVPHMLLASLDAPRETLCSLEGTLFVNQVWKALLEYPDVALLFPDSASMECLAPYIAGIITSIPRKPAFTSSPEFHPAMSYEPWTSRKRMRPHAG